jgi:hypothetical protein
MANEKESSMLLDKCVRHAVDIGCIRAADKVATIAFANLKAAIDRYMESLTWLPVEDRPDRGHIQRVMIRNSFLAYQHAMGVLSVEDLPDAFAQLEITFP